jgi:tRNA(fMet)-specific endonuclease VapC
MILLDSDHMSSLRYFDHPRCAALTGKLQAAADPQTATTVISVEEQMRGWLAEIKRRKANKQVPVYAELTKLIAFYARWEVVPFDDRAAEMFNQMRKDRVRIGTQDLKIASIALVNDALLLTANLRDFTRVARLRVENWLE